MQAARTLVMVGIPAAGVGSVALANRLMDDQSVANAAIVATAAGWGVLGSVSAGVQLVRAFRVTPAEQIVSVSVPSRGTSARFLTRRLSAACLLFGLSAMVGVGLLQTMRS